MEICTISARKKDSRWKSQHYHNRAFTEVDVKYSCPSCKSQWKGSFTWLSLYYHHWQSRGQVELIVLTSFNIKCFVDSNLMFEKLKQKRILVNIIYSTSHLIFSIWFISDSKLRKGVVDFFPSLECHFLETDWWNPHNEWNTSLNIPYK